MLSWMPELSLLVQASLFVIVMATIAFCAAVAFIRMYREKK